MKICLLNYQNNQAHKKHPKVFVVENFNVVGFDYFCAVTMC